MSRLKLFLLILIVAALGIVFFQNREPIALKMLCPDNTQSACVYQTPSLPLAIWIGLFTLGGAIAGLLGQTLNRYRYGGIAKVKYAANGSADERPKDFTTTKIQDRNTTVYSAADYEKPQEPESVERSGSTYSYKYKDKKGENNHNNSPKISRDSDIDLNKDDDDEEWI